MDFINKRDDWEFVKEYVEKGVSGYKVTASNRDIIQKARADAENGLFDVLLVYMFDRLGRRDDETPFVLEWFVSQGIEMWSVKEGQQKIEDHTDKLINYIRFWQSSGESRKTSIRVNDKHAEMVKAGVYRGGTVPYGYKTVNSGVLNKKGKDLLKVVIDEEKAEIVKMIYDLVLEEGYGQNRIAGLLNTKGYPSKTDKKWSSASVNTVLRNPMYKGYMTYNKGKENEVTSKEQLVDLVIIDEEKWNKAQKIREMRSPENVKKNDGESVIKTTKGILMLVGIIKCGHCGYPLTTTYNKKTYVRKDGTKRVTSQAKYRCSGKAQMKTDCDGQTIYASKKIEGIVLEELFDYLQQLNQIDLTKQIQKLKKQNTNNEVKTLRKLERELDAANLQLTKLNEEVIKSIMGQSHYSPERLNNIIESKEKEVKELNKLVEEAQQELDSKKIELHEVEELKKHIPIWREVFENASSEKKKMMLSTVIERVVVYKDNVEITFKININQFVKNGVVKKAQLDSQLS
ncbi:recombinase family protein [Metabacillus sp. B2-18]|uniref:recombinase family protein n=1 Tax=Metabacillus sp. B2-18 TaxID=2897333 RepID=UPI001E424703|nr:recombinase family protein [Metabacillus sp. B2-18]UGB29946.1 recombinase family protein [Metabacillus sp. B2-18]